MPYRTNISDKQQRGYNSPSNGETKSPIKTGNMASEQGEQSPTIIQNGQAKQYVKYAYSSLAYELQVVMCLSVNRNNLNGTKIMQRR